MAGSRVPDVVNAGVDILKADSTLITLLEAASVYTHVPKDTLAPYVWAIGGDEIAWAEAFGDDDNAGRQVDFLAQCVSTYRGSAQVDAIASRVMDVLLDDTAWNGITGYQAVQFVRNTALPPTDLNSDGVLWFMRTVTVRVTLI